MKTRKNQRIVIITSALFILFSAVGLVFYALGGDSVNLFLQPSEISEKDMKSGQYFRLGGLVDKGSLSRAEDGLTYHFTVTDCVTDQPVRFKGLLPDLFREGQGVVIEGSLNDDKVFIASTVLAKHDENYAAPGTMPKNTDACQHPSAGMYAK